MFNFKNILETFLKNTYYLLFMAILTWTLVFLKPEWMYVWFYYSDPKNWLEDSTNYLFIGILIFLAMVFFIVNGLLQITQKKYKDSLPWMIIPLIVFFIMNYVAKTALEKEIRPVNYKQYLTHSKISNFEAQKVASMFKKDCQITVLELNEDLFGIYQWNPQDDLKLNLKNCKTTNKSKKELIDYLQADSKKYL